MASREPIRSIVIVGGGTSGWMTAASLAQRLAQRDVRITLVESSAIGTIGVGEATVPAIRSYFASLGLDAFEVMKASNGSFKLGIEFDGWREAGHRFFHSFGRYGLPGGPVEFHHIWQRLREAGEPWPLSDYCLGDAMAYAGRFRPQDPQARGDFLIYDWAVHFDAGLFARLLRGYAEQRGVTRIDAKITGVVQQPETGFVERVKLDSGAEVAGDLFIDCSGFRGLLIQGAMQAGFNNWSHWLPCDRAVAIPCKHNFLRSNATQASPRISSGGQSALPQADASALGNSDNFLPLTRSKAMTAGWTWRIPLQHRVGNGYVYASAQISDDEAEAALRAELDGEVIGEPNFVRFTAGHAKKLWDRNVVAIGLSGGFLEPLESTSITLIQVGIDKLLQLFPNRDCAPALAEEYNRRAGLEYERIRDFIILHYWANKRSDGELWRACREMEIPDTLQAKYEAWKARGVFVRYDHDSFFDPSWLCMWDGFDIQPDAYDPFTDNFPLQDLTEVCAHMRRDVQAMAKDAPSHADFIRQYCAAAG
ncbi:MAG: tryptophan halogenase family protein [Asticcacaulis sp.]|uniref:tryptophan halogenase family protein n=1 Tax=Asticcacaulis sp. TaxID=1872648 RepID=UPI003F7B6E1B